MKNNERVKPLGNIYIRESLLPQLSKTRTQTGDTPSMIINEALEMYFKHILHDQGEMNEENRDKIKIN